MNFRKKPFSKKFRKITFKKIFKPLPLGWDHPHQCRQRQVWGSNTPRTKYKYPKLGSFRHRQHRWDTFSSMTLSHCDYVLLKFLKNNKIGLLMYVFGTWFILLILTKKYISRNKLFVGSGQRSSTFVSRIFYAKRFLFVHLSFSSILA